VAIAVPTAGAATWVFDPSAPLRIPYKPTDPIAAFHNVTLAYNGTERVGQVLRGEGFRGVRIDQRTARVADTVRLPGGQPVEIVTARLTQHVGVCAIAVLGGHRLLQTWQQPCSPYRAAVNRQAGSVYALTGFEDPNQVDVRGPGKPVRLLFGMLSPGIDARAAKVRLTGVDDPSDPQRVVSVPDRPTVPVHHGTYAIVVTHFTARAEIGAHLEALDAQGRVIARF
jgi:hypothetical protein